LEPYNLKTVTYNATGEQDIVIFQKPIESKKYKEPDMLDGNMEASELTLDDLIKRANHCINSSLSRTKQTVYDYARANVWDYFLTFTFDAQKVNRYDYDEVSQKLSKWLRNLKQRKAPDMKYIIVPELHKDGAYHFHALASNCGALKFIDSGRKAKGHTIYNLPDFKLGFTTASKVKDTLKASNYITKYLTKELIHTTKDQRRYWNSKNLQQGEIETSLMDSEAIEIIKNAYAANHKRHKKMEIARNDFHQQIDYFTV
jgi:hypothetical protein